MKLIIHTLVPIHIGGKDLSFSPYTDYVSKKEKENHLVYYLNTDKLMEVIESKGYMDSYIKFLKDSAKNTGSKFDLKTFLEQKNIDYKKFIRERLPLKIKEDNPGRIEIKGFIRSPSGRYIPGTSIKGAIKTALWYSYIKRRAALGKEGYQKIFNEKGPKFVFTNTFGKRYGATKYEPLRDPFRDIQIGDSDPIPYGKFQVIDMSVFHLKRLKPESPIWIEALNGRVYIPVRIKFTNYANPDDEFWHFIEKGDYKTMFSHINTFSSDFINHEKKVLESKKGDNTYIAPMLNSYTKLQEKIDTSNNEKAYIPIGQGTSFFSKTVDMVFSYEEMENIRKKFKSVSLGYKKDGHSNPFPITRKVLEPTKGHLVGWIELYIRED